MGEAFGSVLLGLEPRRVRVVATRTQPGARPLEIVGLSDTAAREASVRVLSSLRTILPELAQPLCVNVELPDQRVDTACLDLAIAAACLRELGRPIDVEDGAVFLGELALDGRIRAVRGALCHVLGEDETREYVVPRDNEWEVGLAAGSEGVWYSLEGVWSARELVDLLEEGRSVLELLVVEPSSFTSPDAPPADLPSPELREALEAALIAPAGVLLVGRHGSGSVLLARRLNATIDLSGEQALEIATIHSAAGLVENAHVLRAPFRAPHHSISEAALVGGGVRPRPGEVSLAHHGVLFLDEVVEFRRSTLDALAAVLEAGHAQLGGVRFPAAPRRVVASAVPCPCGYKGSRTRACFCPPLAIERHELRLSAIAEMLGLVTVYVPELALS